MKVSPVLIRQWSSRTGKNFFLPGCNTCWSKLRYVKLEGEAKAQKTCTASSSQMLLQIITRVRNGEQHEHDTEDGLGRLSLSACFTRGCLLGIWMANPSRPSRAIVWWDFWMGWCMCQHTSSSWGLTGWWWSMVVHDRMIKFAIWAKLADSIARIESAYGFTRAKW